ncbi:MAG: hypothetical protein HYX92_01850 [Chloroflexi bacterium]|nr:hypothetical protein [Chloroflexota bacterium]
MDILHLIDRLESLVTSSASLPVLRKTLVDEQRLLDLIDQMRVAVPEDVREAHQVIQERHSLLEQAATEARRITEAAEVEQRTKVQQTEVVKAAERKAQEIVAEAQRQAQSVLADARAEASRTKEEAAQYAGDILRKLDVQLTALQEGIRKGLDALRKTGPGAE